MRLFGTKREISEQWANHLEKNVEELRASKKRCYEKSIECVKKIRTSFASVGAFSSEENFIRGDPEGPIEWISHEAEAFEEVLNGRGDICAFSGARGIATVLERKGCDHVKSLAQTEADLSSEDIKDPSAEASLVGGKFFTDIWENGGREMAQEIIRRIISLILSTRRILLLLSRRSSVRYIILALSLACLLEYYLPGAFSCYCQGEVLSDTSSWHFLLLVFWH